MPQAVVGAPNLRDLWPSGVAERRARSPRRWKSGKHQWGDAASLGGKQRGQGGQRGQGASLLERGGCRGGGKLQEIA